MRTLSKQAGREPCPYNLCDGSGFLFDEQGRTASDCRCRALRIARRRARSLHAKVPQLYLDVGFDRFPLNELQPEVLEFAREYADQISERIAAGRGIWLMGAVGSGKTALAMALVKAALERGHGVAIYSTPELFKALRDAIGDQADPLGALYTVELLVLDDLGAQNTTPWALEQLYLLVDARYRERRPVIATSNLYPNELAEQLSAARVEGSAAFQPTRDPFQLGWRVVSRLVEICGDPLWLGDRDLRREYRPPR